MWDGGPTGAGTNWLDAVNWAGDVVPGPGDNAIFDSAGSATTVRINMDAVGGQQQVGAITVGPGRTAILKLRNYPASTNGTLQINGAGGVLLSNTAALSFTINSVSGVLDMRLGASGDILVAQNGVIQLYSNIFEIGGARGVTKRGQGILYLRGTNTFSSNVTITAGAIKVDNIGTLGAGTVYLAGGDLISGLDRSGGAPLANPIVLTSDGIIYNDGGIAGTSRTLPFSGSAGTLTIANLTLVQNNTFIVRWLGGFTFNRPIIVGADYDTSGSFSVLQLYNSATNGTLTLTGNISGQGSLRRQGASGSPPAIAILTGNNTYSGGTLITYGTLLANNTAGSVLGSGAVTVTNQGVLGGSGTVTAPTTVASGGTLAPGATTNSFGNLCISDLTLSPGARLWVQIGAATGTPGVNWDSVTCSNGWTDAASATNPIVIKLDTLGAAPRGRNPTVARSWKIIQSGSATGFDACHFSIDATDFVGASGGIFSVIAVSDELHLQYTPAADVVINVPSGSVTRGQTSPTPYPLISGTDNTSRIAVFSGSAINTLGGTLTITNGAAATTNNIFEVRLVGAGFNFSRPIVLDNGTGAGNRAQLYLGSSNGTPARTFSGVISGNGRLRSSSVATTDAGTTVLTAANTYSSGTEVAAGTLLVNNTSGSGTGPGAVTVTSPGVLGGTGSIAGAVSGTGTISPGVSAGTLTLGGGLNLSGGGTYLWELTALSTHNPGVNFDVLALTGGNLVLGGSAKLRLAFSGSATPPDTSDPFWLAPRTWTIVTLSGSAANPGGTRFADIPNSTYAAGSFTNYADTAGNIVLQYVPAVPPTPPAIVGSGRLGDGNFGLTFTGPTGQGYSVWASADVTLPRANWSLLATGTFCGAPVTFHDLGATNFLQRFYRISAP